MNTNILIGIIVELGSVLIILVGFILAIVFFIMARSEKDTLRKKKLDKRAIWSFIGPILLVVVSRVIVDVTNNSNNTNNNATTSVASCDIVAPTDSSVVWKKYCNDNFGFYYPDGWNVEYASLINLLVITSPVINNYPGYAGKLVEYAIPYGVESSGGKMVLQSYGFVVVDASGKVIGKVAQDQAVIQSRSEPTLGSAIINSFKQF